MRLITESVIITIMRRRLSVNIVKMEIDFLKIHACHTGKTVNTIVNTPVSIMKPKYAAGIPAANSIPIKTGKYVLAVPMSGCTRISKAGAATISRLIKSLLKGGVFSECAK